MKKKARKLHYSADKGYKIIPVCEDCGINLYGSPTSRNYYKFMGRFYCMDCYKTGYLRG